MTQQQRSWLRRLFKRKHGILPRHRRNRVMLSEQLEPRQLLAADLEGDSLASAQLVSITPNVDHFINDAVIGDGNYGDSDVDLFRVDLAAGQTITVDVDAEYDDEGSPISGLDSYLRLFDSSGQQLASNDYATADGDHLYEYQGYYETYFYDLYTDAYLTHTVQNAGSYYIGVSSSFNSFYDPNTAGSGSWGSTGEYHLRLLTDATSEPTIGIDDPQPVSEESGSISFQVTLSEPSANDVTFSYTTLDGSATSPSDYTPVSGTLTFAPGETSKPINVDLINDNIVEPSESLDVILSDVSGAIEGDLVGQATIVNDDVTDISITDATVDETAGTADLTVSLSWPTYQNVTFNYSTVGETAAAGQDYTSVVNAPGIIAAGETSVSINVPLIDDAEIESDESFRVELSTIVGAGAGILSATATIDSDDVPSISIGDINVNEGVGIATFTVSLSEAGVDPIRVGYAIDAGTATEGPDYRQETAWTPRGNVAVTPNAIVAPDGSLTADLVEGLERRNVNDLNQIFHAFNHAELENQPYDVSFWIKPVTTDRVLRVVNPSSGTVGGEWEVDLSQLGDDWTQITVDHPAVTVRTPFQMNGGLGGLQLSSAPPNINDIIDAYFWGFALEFQGSTTPYATETLTFAPGETSKQISVYIINDNLVEPNETIDVHLQNIDGAVGDDTVAQATIVSDDLPVVSISDAIVNEATQTTLLPIADAYVRDGSYADANFGDQQDLEIRTSASTSREAYLQFDISDLPSSDEVVLQLHSRSNNMDPGTTLQHQLHLVDPEWSGDAESSITWNTTRANNLLGTLIATWDVHQQEHANGKLYEIDVAAAVEQARNAGQDKIAFRVSALTIDGLRAASYQSREKAGQEPRLIIGPAGETATFTVSLDQPGVAPVSVAYSTSAGTATASEDFAASTGTLNFAVGETSKTIEVDIVPDSTVEASETFDVVLSGVSGAFAGDLTGQATIIDDDVITISIGDVTINETDGTAEFTVSLNRPNDQDVTFNYSTVDQTATAGDDYAAVINGAEVIAVGETSVTISVPLIDDAEIEVDETFRVELTGVVGAEAGDLSATATIDSDDLPAISVGDISFNEYIEGDRIATFTVTLSEPGVEPVKASYQAVEGTAIDWTDYFPEASWNSRANVTVTPNAAVAPDGSMTADLVEGLRLAGGNDLSQLFYAFDHHELENQPYDVSFSIKRITTDQVLRIVNQSSGLAGGHWEVDLAQLSDDWERITKDHPAVTVITPFQMNGILGGLHVAAIAQPADAYFWGWQLDFAGSTEPFATNTLTFAPGETSKQVSVLIVDEPYVEEDETFDLVLSNVQGAVEGDLVGQATIVNDDLTTLSIADVTVNESAGTADVTVSLNWKTFEDVTFNYTTADESAAAGQDYTSVANAAGVIAAGETSVTISVPLIDDTEIEADESFRVELSNVVGADEGDLSASATIVNDDLPNLSIGDIQIDEAAADAVFTATLSEAAADVVTIDYAALDGTATAGSDYLPTTGTLTFPAGITTRTISVPLVSEGLVEPDETFTVLLTNPAGATLLDDSAIGTILNDDDPANIPAISPIANVTIAEDGTTAAIPLTLSDADSDPADLSITATSSNANLLPIDPAGHVILSGAAANRSLQLIPVANAFGTAEIVLTVVDEANQGSSQTVTVTVTPVNDAPTIDAIADQSVDAGSSLGPILFSINDLEDDSSNITVTAASGDASIIGDADISLSATGSNRELTISPPAGPGGSVLITVTAEDASGAIATETFTVTVNPSPPPTGDLEGDQLNEALPVALQPGVWTELDAAIGDGDFGSADVDLFRLFLEEGQQVKVDVDANYLNDGSFLSSLDSYLRIFDSAGLQLHSNSAGDSSQDYEYAFNMYDAYLSFIAETTGYHYIGVSGEDFYDGGNTNYDPTTRGSGGPGTTGAYKLQLLAEAAPVPSINISDAAANEGGGTAAFAVTLSEPPTKVVTVDFTTTEGTASAGDDYVTTSGSISFPIGVTTQTISVPLVDEGLVEPNESFTVTLSDPANATLLDDSAVGTIVNDDDIANIPSISAISNVSVAEDGSTSPLTVTLSDADSDLTGLTLVASSNNANLLPTDPAGHVILTGSAANRSLQLIPVANQHGNAQIVLTVTDELNQSSSHTINVAVTSVNDAPTIDAIADQSTSEDTAGAVSIVIADIDTNLDSLTLTATSSDQSLVADSGLQITGTGSNRSLTFTPMPNASGTATITVDVGDGANTVSTSFQLAVTEVNDAPTVGSIADGAFDAGSSLGPITVAVGDAEDHADDITVTATSSDTSIIDSSGISISPSGASRELTLTAPYGVSGDVVITVTATDTDGATATESFNVTVNYALPAPTVSQIDNLTLDEDSGATPIDFVIGDLDTPLDQLTTSYVSSNESLVASAPNPVVGTGSDRSITLTPQPNQYGSTTITVTVGDGSQETTESFLLTVTPINDAPTIASIDDLSTPEDTADSVAITIGDIETDPALLTLSAASSDPTVITGSGLQITGTGSNRSLSFTPVANASGIALITVTVSDGAATATTTFQLTVDPVNDAPTLGAVGNQSVDAGSSLAPISFSVADLEDDADSITVTAVSSDTSIIDNSNISVTTTGPSRELSISAPYGVSGDVVITVTATDTAGATATETLTVTVNPSFAPPTITAIDDLTIGEDAGATQIDFQIGDLDTPLQHVTTWYVSSNESLVPSATAPVSGVGSDRSITLTPQPNQSGTATITVTVSDGNNETTETFQLTVTPINDPPVTANVLLQVQPHDVVTFYEPMFAYSDTEGDAMQHLRIASLPGTGQLFLGSLLIQENDIITPSDIRLGELTYRTRSSDVATALSFVVNDGQDDSSMATIQLDVASANPNSSPTTKDDIEYTTHTAPPLLLSVDRFAFVDAESLVTDPNTEILIVELPNRGSLELDGTPIQENQQVSLADVGDAKLSFVPDPTVTSGVYETKIGFAVSDGELYSNYAELTVHVDETLNAAPLAGDSTWNLAYGQTYTIFEPLLGYADPEGAPLDHITFTAVPSQGSLKLDGVEIAADTEVTAAEIAEGRLSYHTPDSSAGSFVESVPFTVHDGFRDSRTEGHLLLDLQASPNLNRPPTTSSEIVPTSIVRTVQLPSWTVPFSDPDGSDFDHLLITRLPTDGVLSVDDGSSLIPVTQNMVVSIDDLRYTPAPTAVNAYWDQIGYAVSDGEFYSNFGELTLAVGADGIDPIADIKLLNDTGDDATDLITVNPTLQGTLQGAYGDEGLRVDFDHNLDGVIDGSISFSGTLPISFFYDPRLSDSSLVDHVGAVYMRYRLTEVRPDDTTFSGRWVNYDYTMEAAPVSDFTVNDLAHVAARGTAPNTGLGFTLTGNVDTGGAGVPPVPVEIDIDGDGAVDVTADTDSFLELDVWHGNLPAGDYTLRARAVEYDSSLDVDLKGPWAEYELSWTNSLAPAFETIELANDTGFADFDRVTEDPTVSGSLVTPYVDVDQVQVEYDIDGDAAVDGQECVGPDGLFVFTLASLAAGAIPLRLRTTAWDTVDQVQVTGEWVDFTFTYQPAESPEIMGLRLLVDDGEFSDDRVTTNATIFGQVAPASGENLAVFIDHDGDGTAEATVTPQPGVGSFLYTPTGLAYAEHTLTVWAERTNPYLNTIETSSSTNITFTLVELVNESIAVADLQLKYDTGVDSSDLVTSNPTVTGNLVNDGSVAYLTVEFDVDGDGVVDGDTIADESGAFEFTPIGISVGPQVVAARGVEYDHVGAQLIAGSWATFAYSYVATTNTAPVVTELSLLSDSGTPDDLISENTTLVGSIIDDGSIGGVTIEIDVDQDGLPDQTAFTRADGGFEFEPIGITWGSVTVQARAVEFDFTSSTNLVGAWQPISFSYVDQPDEPPRLANVSFDAGSALTGVHPSAAGNVTSQQSVDDILIDVDFDSDGVADYITTTSSGAFNVDLVGLPDNTTAIDIRAVSQHPLTNKLMESDWQQLTINYVLPAFAGAAIGDFKLVDDTGDGDTDKITGDPRVNGTVSRSALGRLMAVEIDQDGDPTTIEGSVIVNSDLTWTYSPSDLPPGDVTLSARTKDTLADGQLIYGSWTDFDFTLVSEVDATGTTEQQEHESSIEEARAQAQEEISAAESQYSSSVTSANHAQQAADAAADSQYQQETATAEANLAAAMNTAAANLQTNLANFAGDTTSYEFDPLVWPDAPKIKSFEIPDDETQPVPPRRSPEYTGPKFEFDKNPTYQAATELAYAKYEAAAQDAKQTRETADNEARELFNLRVAEAEEQSDAERQVAEELYEVASMPPTEAHLRAFEQYFAVLQQEAQDNYDHSMAEAEELLDNFYDSDASPEERHAAGTAYIRAWADAELARSLGTNLSNSLVPTSQEYHELVQQHAYESRMISIAATIGLELAIARIDRDLAKSIADLEHERDLDMFANAKSEMISLEQAFGEMQVGLSQAKRNAIALWDNAIGSKWTKYQLALAENEIEYQLAMRQSRNAHTQTISDAQETRDLAIADASIARKYEIADQLYDRAHARTEANGEYWRASALTGRDAGLDEVARRHIHGRAWHEANHASVSARAAELYVWIPIDGTKSNNYRTGFYANDGPAFREIAVEYSDGGDTAWSVFGSQLHVHLNHYQETAAQIDRDHSAGTVASENDFLQAAAAARTAYVETVAPADKSLSDLEVQHIGARVQADAADWQSFLVSEATSYQSRIQDWHASTDSAWSAYRVDLAILEVDWATESGDSAIAYASATSASDVIRRQRVATAERDYSTLVANAEQGRIDAIVDLEETYVSDAAAIRFDYATSRAGHASVISQESMADHTAERIEQRSELGAFYDELWMAESNIKPKVGQVNPTEEAMQAVLDARASSLSHLAAWSTVYWNEFWNTCPLGFCGFDTIPPAESPIDIASAIDQERLETDLFSADSGLAFALGNVSKDYTTTLIGLDASRQLAMLEAENLHLHASTLAAEERNFAIFIADAARRDGGIVARGNYEARLHSQFADNRWIAASNSNTPLSVVKAAIATADHVRFDSVRAAHDVYQAQLTAAQLNQAIAIKDANIDRVVSLNNATLLHAQTIIPAQIEYEEAIAHVSTNLSVATEIAALEFDNRSAISQLRFVTAEKIETSNTLEAIENLEESNSAAEETAYQQFYGDAYALTNSLGSLLISRSDSYSEAIESLGILLSNGYEATVDSARLETALYETRVGDLDTIRATALGDAEIGRVYAETTAAVDYVTVITTNEAELLNATLVARTEQEGLISAADQTHLVAIADANREATINGLNAYTTLSNAERVAEVTHATSVAVALALFQQDVSAEEAELAFTIAESSGLISDWFQADYFIARANWIAAISDDFVTHYTVTAAADAQAENDVDVARSNRDSAIALADALLIQTTAQFARDRSLALIAEVNTYESALVSLENDRFLSAAQNLERYERDIADANRLRKIKIAEADKQRFVNMAHGEMLTHVVEHDYDVGRADATLMLNTATVNAEFEWRQSEATASEVFTTLSAPLDHSLDIAIADLEHSHATGIANAELIRENTKIAAEEAFFAAKYLAESNRRSVSSAANVALWTAMESARVDAYAVIHNATQSPWTQYLVDFAATQFSWWSNQSASYIDFIADRNAVEAAHNSRLVAAFGQREQAIAEAYRDHAIAAADAQRVETIARADSIRDFLSDLVAPVLIHRDVHATAQRDWEIVDAQSTRDFVFSNDLAQYNQDRDGAIAQISLATESADLALRFDEATQLANKEIDFSSAELNRTLALVAADVAFASANNDARREYLNEESAASLARTSELAEMEASYRQAKANSLASSAANMNASAPSPWASYEADQSDALANHVTQLSNATKAKIVGLATAQHAVEASQTNAEKVWSDLITEANGVLQSTLANADHQRIEAEAVNYVVLNRHQIVPSFEQPPSVDSRLNFAARLESSFLGDVRFPADDVRYPLDPWPWWHEQFTSDPPDIGNAFEDLSRVVGLHYNFALVWTHDAVEPDLPAYEFDQDYWQIATDSTQERIYDYSVEMRYGHVLEELGLVGRISPNASMSGYADSASIEIDDGTEYDPAEVGRVLSALDPEAGEEWALHGAAHRNAVTERPKPDLDATNPRLNLRNAKTRTFADESTDSDSSSESGNDASSSTATAREQRTSADDRESSIDVAHRTAEENSANVEQRTRFENVNHYLAGFTESKDGPDVLKQASAKIAVNWVIARFRSQDTDGGKWGSGFAKGFIKQGAEAVEDVWSLAAAAWNSGWTAADYLSIRTSEYLATKYAEERESPGVALPIYSVGSAYFAWRNSDGEALADAAETEVNVLRASILAHQILDRVIATSESAGRVAAEHYLTLKHGTPEELRQLGSDDRKFAAVVMSIGVLLSEKLKDLSDEERGEIAGAITWEIAQAAVEIVFTAGTAAAVSKGVKFTRIADKLNDYAKASNGLSNLGQEVLKELARITDDGGELRRLLEKFDAKNAVPAKTTAALSGRIINQLTCFVAGTPVLTPNGSKPIEQFQPGDSILSRSDANPTAPVRATLVEKVFEASAPVVHLRVGGRVIETTAEHPVYVRDKGWTRICDLNPGDELASEKEAFTAVEQVIATNKVATVYNLRVADDHTYFVGDESWGFSVWVHNTYVARKRTIDGQVKWRLEDEHGNLGRTAFASREEAYGSLRRSGQLTHAQIDELRALTGFDRIGEDVAKRLKSITVRRRTPGVISGDPGALDKIRERINNPRLDPSQRLDAAAELEVIELLQQKGKNAYAIDDLRGTTGGTNDVFFGGGIGPDGIAGEVKRVTSWGTLARRLAKAVQQVGEGGTVFVKADIPGSTLEDIARFLRAFTPSEQNIAFVIVRDGEFAMVIIK